MKFAKVHIFTEQGATYTFMNVVNFAANESMIIFSFIAQSDGQVKRATFFVNKIVGYTTLTEGDADAN